MQPAAKEHEVQGLDLSDKRGIERLPVRLMVADTLRSAPLGLTRDLSVDGFFLQSEQRLPMGTMAPMSLTLEGGEELRVQAEVVRWASDGMGMRFGEMDKEGRKRVRKLVAALASIDTQRRTAVQLQDPSTRTTEPLADEDAIRRRLEQAGEGRVDMRLFPSERPAQDDARIETVERERLVLKTKTATQMKVGETVLVLMTLQYVSYSFTSTVLKAEGRRVELAMPESLAFSERRTRNREPAPSGARLRVPAPWDTSQLLEWQVVDLGSGGVGVLASESMGTLFPGTPLPGAILDFGGRSEAIEHATVRNVRRVERPDGSTGYRIGISFGVQRQAVVDKSFHSREKSPRGWVGKLGAKLSDLQNTLSYLWHTRVFPRTQAANASIQQGTVPLSFVGKRGLTIRGLVNRAFDEDTVPSCPVVLILPGFAGRKEQTSGLAHIIADHFRRNHEQVMVIRLDGTNNLGESDKDAGCETEGKHLLHYTVSGAAEDMLECLEWLRRGELVEATDISVVSVSFSSVAVRHALATGRAPEVRRWVSWMGAADARDAVLHVSGYSDLYRVAEIAQARNESMGTVTLMGCMVDVEHVWSDMYHKNIGTLEDARREIAQVQADVLWVKGEFDAWMDPVRIHDVMSIPAPGSREVLTGDSGHMPQSGPEASRQFGQIASWLQLRLTGRTTPLKTPSLGWLKAMSDWEWQRVRRTRPVNSRQFWADYLLDDRGPGFDILQHSPAYTSFMDLQASLVNCEGADVLELGAGTGNLSERLLQRGPGRIIVTDLVPEAVDRLRTRFESDPRVGVQTVDLEGSPAQALRRFQRGELAGVKELFRRIPGVPSDIMDRLGQTNGRALHGLLSGFDVSMGDLQLPSNAPEYVSQVLEEIGVVARWVRGAGMSGAELDGQVSFRHLNAADFRKPQLLPFADETFDVVVLSLVVSYVGNPDDALSEIRRVLRPGGQLLMSTMRRDADSSKNWLEMIELFQASPLSQVGSEENREQLIASARRFLDRASDLFRMEEEGLYVFWDPSEFAQLARFGGFERCRTIESFGVPPQAVILTCHKPVN